MDRFSLLREVAPLIAKLQAYADNVVPQSVSLKHTNIHTDSRIYGKEDGSDTDLVHGVFSNAKGDVCVCFWIEITPDAETIIDIDLTNVDIIIEGEIYDCINLGKRYHLNIISGAVTLPEELCGEFSNLNDACSRCADFVHSYDDIMQVDARVVDENGDDVEYYSSLYNLNCN